MSAPAKLSGVATGTALVVLVAWLLFLGFLARHTGATDTEWARLIAILGSLEAVAFGAAGALFGVTIQRQRVQDAKERADKADERTTEAFKKADANAAAAARGQALASAIKSRATSRSEADQPQRTVSIRERSEDDIVRLARDLFPD